MKECDSDLSKSRVTWDAICINHAHASNSWLLSVVQFVMSLVQWSAPYPANMTIGSLAGDDWAHAFGTVRSGVGLLHCTKCHSPQSTHHRPVYGHISLYVSSCWDLCAQYIDGWLWSWALRIINILFKFLLEKISNKLRTWKKTLKVLKLPSDKRRQNLRFTYLLGVDVSATAV